MSSANARAQKPEWLVRVPGDGGAVAGAGVLIDQYHVVTCAHVVANQFGEPSPTAGTGPAPNDAATVEFPFSGSAAVRRVAQVVEWQPIAEDLSGDAAVLRLAEPVVATAAPLAFPSSVLGHRFSVHGFPSGDSAARYVTGRLGGASGPTGDWLQLDADSGVGWAVERGFSGAPVFDHDVGAVVGIVVMTDAHRSGHMLPMSALRSWWPWLLDRRVEDASWTAHWLPRARGSERQSDTGVWYFTGRDAARQRVCDWLADPTAPALVVTGGPGTGKSALLAHLLVTANPAWADVVPTSGPRPPVGAFDVAIHISGLSGDDVVRQVADAVGLDVATAPELLAAMRQRRQAGQMPVVMVADAVEEAASVAEARQIAVLLRNLAGTGAARVLAGVRTAPSGTKRAEILGAFGSIPRLPLESRAFQRNEDVADYVCLRLTHDDFQSRYRNRPPGELRRISWAIARRARYNFLIAQLTTLWLTQATTPPLNIGEPGWERILPETVGEAMEEYLRHCGADPELVRRILTALAFSRGSGLPFGCSWLTISDALHPAHTHTLADLETVFHSAANYLIERTDDGNEQASYRLYHHALDEHLRDHCTKYTPQPNPHQAIVRALIDALPVREHGRDWATADAYTRTHLAGHAVEAQQLDTVLDDPSFLLYAEPGPLLTALSHARTEEGQLVASTYRLSQHQHRHRHPVDRCRILALDAARLGANELQHRINTAQKHLMAPDQVIWRVRFATGSRLPTAAIATLTGHTNEVNAVAVTELDGRPIAVTGGMDGTVRTWDLIEQRAIGAPMTGHTNGVNAVAVTELDGRRIAVTGGMDGTVRTWDLIEQRAIDVPMTGHTNGVNAVAVTELDGRRIAVTGGMDGTVRVWDLVEQRATGEPLTGHSYDVSAVAVTDVDGRPMAVTGGIDGTVRVWDLVERGAIGKPLTGHTNEVSAIAVTEVAGRSVVVSGSRDRTVRMWDLAGHRGVGEPLTGHADEVSAIAVTQVAGRSVVVSGSRDRTVRMWDLAGHRGVGEPLTGHADQVNAIAVTQVAGRPMAITGGVDGTVRAWNLTEERVIGKPLAGHTDEVNAVDVTELAGRPIAVTGGRDRTIRMWDVVEQRVVGEPLTGHTDEVRAVVILEVDRYPIALAVTGDGEMRLWDLPERRAIDALVSGHSYNISAVAVAKGGRQLAAVTGGMDGTVQFWDLVKLSTGGWEPVTGHTNWVSAVAMTEWHGYLTAVTGGRDHMVRIWNVHNRCAIGEPLTGHTGEVTAVAMTELDGRPIAVTGGRDHTVRVWDVVNRRAIGEPLTGHTGEVTAVATAELDGRPIAVTGGRDHTVRTWDLKNRRCLDELVMPDRVRCLTLGLAGTLIVGFGFDIAAFDTSTPVTAPRTPRVSITSLPSVPSWERRPPWWYPIVHR